MSKFSQYTEEQLVGLIREGDAAAFTAMYDKYKERLAVRLLQLVRNEAYAEELLQDVFMKIWEGRAQINPDLSFKAYLYRITTNVAFNFMKRASKERGILAQIIQSSTELYNHIEADLLRKENQRLIDRVLTGLSAQCRQVFVAVKLDGLSHNEAAERFGISTHTVNNHLQKGTRYLKGYLKSSGELPLLLVLYLFS
ncbi:RNA polymerase sigma factor [Parapedobacter deserti]|uniref:RNA polymerase sigma factor n=1 Tax=Parapedobacter deserti TaxID=1912957 RepID=A0ABV7JJ43_9SPHI